MAQINITQGTNLNVAVNRGPLNGGAVGGTNAQVQFNKNGVLGGVSNVTSQNGGLVFSQLTDLKINGGAPDQVMVTDGAGNLRWEHQTSGDGAPSGPDFSIQIANNNSFYGEGDFSYVPGSKTLFVPQVVTDSVSASELATDDLTISNSVVMPVLANIQILGGSNGQVIATDGAGNLQWTTLPVIEDTPPAGSNTQIQFNDDGAFGADPELFYNKSSNTLNAINISATNFYGNGENLTDINGANVFGVVPLANSAYWSGNATTAQSAQTAVSADFAETVTGPYQPNILTVGTLEHLTVEGVINLNDLSNITITGGNIGEVITTDGAGNLYWAYVSGGGGGNTQFANYANFAGNVTVPAQPLITSLGTLTALSVAGVTDLGPVSNVKITGGNIGEVLSTDGNGVLAWVAPSAPTISYQPSFSFTAPVDGAFQTFNSPYVNSFASAEFVNISVNGVVLQLNEFGVSGTVLTVKRFLRTGDVVIVGSAGTGGGGNVPNAYPTLNGNGKTVLTGTGHWVLAPLTTQSDASITYADTGANPVTNLPTGTIISAISISITEAFDNPTTILTVTISNGTVIMDSTDSYPQVAGTYSISPSYSITAPTVLSINLGGGVSSVGKALITVSYQ